MVGKLVVGSKLWWVLIPVLAGLLAVFVFGTVYALGKGYDESQVMLGYVAGKGGVRWASDPKDTETLAIVADLLGVELVELEEAFANAGDRQAAGNFYHWLDHAVVEGKLSDAERELVMEWFDSRPLWSAPIAARIAFTEDNEVAGAMLRKWEKRGYLDEPTAAALLFWHAERPEVMPKRYSGMFGWGKHDDCSKQTKC